MTITEFRFDSNGSIIEPEIDLRTPSAHQTTVYRITFTSGETTVVAGADTYQPEGAMTTFFTTGSNRGAIDSWSTRIASYRTAEITSIARLPEAVPEDQPDRGAPSLPRPQLRSIA